MWYGCRERRILSRLGEMWFLQGVSEAVKLLRLLLLECDKIRKKSVK